MDADLYRNALRAAKNEYLELMDQRIALEKRITKLRETITSLERLCRSEDDESDVEMPSKFPRGETGLTDAVRDVLTASDDFVSPIQVRDGLVKMGFPIILHKNPLASIHVTLKRLVEKDEVALAIDERDGKTVYALTASKAAQALAEAALSKGKAIAAAKSGPVIDAFVGQGSGPIPPDIMPNPPYRTGKPVKKASNAKKVIRRK